MPVTPAKSAPEIAILGEFNPEFPPHPATDAAMQHSARRLGVALHGKWLSTTEIRQESLKPYAGIWIAPGSPYKSLENTLLAIRYARENAVPCFGTCGGCQHMIIEYARNVLGYRDAQHAEYDPYASTLLISSLTCSLAGREMRLSFAPDSKVAHIYGGLGATEQYYCNFGVNPDAVPLLKRGAMRFVGSDVEGEIRVLELPEHPFFVATLFVPQMRSQPDHPHPLVTAFLRAAAERADTSHASEEAKTQSLKEEAHA
jgi:CTP synthase (UTP-ammonia lyase)